MSRPTRRTRSTRVSGNGSEEEDQEGLLNHCISCGDYHEGPTGPDCPIYQAKQAEKARKKKTAPKKTDKDPPSGLGSEKVVSLLETIALGMDQLLKKNLDGAEKDPPKGTKDPNRRRSQSVPPKTHVMSYEEKGEEEPTDGDTPSPATFAAMGIPAAIAKMIPGLAATSAAAAAATATKSKSGEHRTASDNVVCPFKWPQEYIYAVNGAPLSHNTMSIVQFVRGFIAMINAAPAEMRPFMLTHLSETMLDAEKFSWESVRRFQADLFHTIEAGKITFQNLESINLLRLRHSFEPVRVQKPTGEGKPGTPRPTLASEPCVAYNKGECPKQAKQHDGVWHMCSFCKNNREKAIPGHGNHNCLSRQFWEKNGKQAGGQKPAS